jgi:hypothetical protein
MKELLLHPVTSIILKTLAVLWIVYNFTFASVITLLILICAYDAIADFYKEN